MFSRSVYVISGLVLSILLVAGVVIFNYYFRRPPEEPVKIYKVTTPIERVEPEKLSDPSTVTFQPESKAFDTLPDEDIQVPEVPEVEAPIEEAQPEIDDFSETPPITEPEEPLQEDTRVVMLKEIFPEFDRLLDESLELANEMKGATPDNYAEYAAKGEALESEIQGYCQQISEVFSGAVTFISFQGQQMAYDVDFQMIKNSIQGPIPSELEGFFRHTSMREMFGLPEIPPDQLQQMQ